MHPRRRKKRNRQSRNQTHKSRSDSDSRKQPDIQRDEDIEFSLHGDLFYDVYPYPCTCEDRLHDCEGNLRTGEDLEFFTARSPMRYSYLRWGDTSEAYKERFSEYLTRRNARFPHNPIHFDQIYWKDP